MTCVLIRKEETEMQGRMSCGDVTGTEIGMLQLQANKRQDDQELRESTGQTLC